MLRKSAPYVIAAPAALLGAALLALHIAMQARRLALYLHHGLGFTDPACTTGYCDWLAGFFIRHGLSSVLYDHARFAAAAAAILPYKTGYWPFVYPPTMLVPAVALSFFPLAAGYYAFSALATALSVWLLRRAGIAWWCIAIGLCSPAAMWNLYLGQFGLLCGALLIAGLAAMRAAPFRAGLMLGLLCIKPQYALLVPVAALAGRYWRVICAGALTLGCTLALTLLCGGDVWAGYFGPGRAAMSALLDQPSRIQNMGTSVFWVARSLHATLPLADAVQAGVSACCAASAWRLWRRPAAPPLAATAFLTLLASPYGFTDDLAVYSVLLPCLASRGTPWRNAGLVWLWVAPAYLPRFVETFGFLAAPLLPLAALWLSRSPRTSRETIRQGSAVRA